MEVRYLYDTNIFLYHLSGEPKVHRLFDKQFLEDNHVGTSRMIRIELLSFPELTPKEENIIEEMLGQFTMVPISNEIEDIAIYLRRKYSLRIPDAIIAATAYQSSSTLVTHDVKDFKRVTEIRVYDPF